VISFETAEELTNSETKAHKMNNGANVPKFMQKAHWDTDNDMTVTLKLTLLTVLLLFEFSF
jgi:hypothetical protein